ncbi:flagellar hook-length control FliK family protein [Yersinia rochesterensis]|uniref:Flagellar hook-length control FliK family protein n=1 Tax=Yersinia rochesterensis TaxID=1604335 RepID=A0ABM5SJH4_9GAMM|nr:flagellar hook-length control protein FliK [Yersinia rochesterensis]AIN18018.1 flagellar hook-length control FliK family protein [Yersinia rochesterensis]AJI86674.1 flagellar hook-length control FliK family protein [Yersinia frederiksenii Y225]AJJ34517.1 flagellar hook-length control FliK family protein [Yersinia rochesterensis]CRY64871.1 flagellar hook-length control protein FliK [Yersinia kristensenii]
MITLTGFAQAGSQLAADVGNAPIAGNAEEGGTDHLVGFDEVLSQAWVPHQPISLRPSVVMDLITKFDGNLRADDAAILSPTDEQNQQLLDVLLQFHGQNTPVKTVLPVIDSHQIADQLASDKSSPLMNLLKLISPRLDITAQPAVPVGESLLLNRIMPEGISAVIPTILSHITNNSAEVAAPRVESQLTLAANQKEWSQQLHNVLGERLQMQVENKVQHATIRLDPPDMGKIDISVHMEGGKLQVHINASQGDVYRALQQSCAELRQTLTGQNSTAVEVQISANSQQQQQRQQQNQQAHADILAARHIEAQENMSADDGTLLITV